MPSQQTPPLTQRHSCDKSGNKSSKRKKRGGKQWGRIRGIKLHDWVSNKYSGEERVLPLLCSHRCEGERPVGRLKGAAVKERESESARAWEEEGSVPVSVSGTMLDLTHAPVFLTSVHQFVLCETERRFTVDRLAAMWDIGHSTAAG